MLRICLPELKYPSTFLSSITPLVCVLSANEGNGATQTAYALLTSQTMTTPLLVKTSKNDKSEHRARLLQAMASVVTEKGFAACTIADIVRSAGVSKRTFYENFDSKDSCFLALYKAASADSLEALRSSLIPDKPWQHQVDHALHTYFSYLAAEPALVQTLFVEIYQLGPTGMHVRREVVREMAAFVLSVVNAPSLPPGDRQRPQLSIAMAVAAVGAINELVLEAIEKGQQTALTVLTTAASEVVRALTHAGAPTQ